MKQISFEDFYHNYNVKRNSIRGNSLYENTMIDFDEDGIEVVEENDPKNVWTLSEGKEGFILNPGIMYKDNIIGYFICNKKWNKNDEVYILQ